VQGLSEHWTENLIQRKASGTDGELTSGAHIGAGILRAYILQSALHQPVTPVMVGVAIGLGLLPDFDAILVRARQHRQGAVGHNQHHAMFTHTPLFFLMIAAVLSLWLSLQSVMFFLVITLGHLMLDSWATDDGIMWLYPLRRKQYALLPRPIHAGGLHGLDFLVAESLLISGGLIVSGMTFMPRLFHLA
jgi:hypothetical protein